MHHPQMVNGLAEPEGFDVDEFFVEVADHSSVKTTIATKYFSRTDASGSLSLLIDVLGSTIALVDSSGTVQTQYSYEPFGTTTATGAANGNVFQFTGRENDGTGLYYYRARYYHPGLARFVSEDPIEFASGDANLYAYVFDNPTTYVDPHGLWGGLVLGSKRGMVGTGERAL